tara:strand:+ start:495 stop:653 length:159 start_codon:yes stop_codon:yes gene_type:complete
MAPVAEVASSAAAQRVVILFMSVLVLIQIARGIMSRLCAARVLIWVKRRPAF